MYSKSWLCKLFTYCLITFIIITCFWILLRVMNCRTIILNKQYNSHCHNNEIHFSIKSTFQMYIHTYVVSDQIVIKGQAYFSKQLFANLVKVWKTTTDIVRPVRSINKTSRCVLLWISVMIHSVIWGWLLVPLVYTGWISMYIHTCIRACWIFSSWFQCDHINIYQKQVKFVWYV